MDKSRLYQNRCTCCFVELTSSLGSGKHTKHFEMILDCFNICFSDMEVQDHFICELCIERLNDAFSFKKTILEAQKIFKEFTIPQYKEENNINEAKSKPEIVSEYKYELEDEMDIADQFDADDDNTIADSDDEPLSMKTKVDDLSKYTAKTTGHSENTPNKKYIKHSLNICKKKNLEILIKNSTVVPFKYRGLYLCFWCSQSFKNSLDLRQHTNAHSSLKMNSVRIKSEIKLDVSEIKCLICNLVFSQINELLNHLKDHDLNYNLDIDMNYLCFRLTDLTCVECDEKFKYFVFLNTHVSRKHCSNIICSKCSKSFRNQYLLSVHNNYHHCTNHKCHKCNEEFDTQSKLNAHMTDVHKFRCHICLTVFPFKSQKLKHLRETHSNDDLTCNYCNKSYLTRPSYLQHSNKCKVGKKVFDDAEKVGISKDLNLSEVKKIRENLACIFNMSTALPFKYFMRKFRCFYCPKDFIESEELREHTSVEHPLCDIKHKSMKLRARDETDIKVDTLLLKCKICSDSFDNLDILIDHLINEHKSNYDKSLNCKLVEFKLKKDCYSCPKCEEKRKDFFNLLIHVNEKHSNNKIVCVYCGKLFRNDTNHRIHINRYHKSSEQQCNLCNVFLPSRIKLAIHMSQIHKLKTKKCSKCPELFTHTYAKLKHLLTVHNVGYSCQYCEKLFMRKGTLDEHVRRTHLKQKNVECNICHLKFFDVYMLRHHMARHVGERNFHCDLCGKKFIWKKNLRKHILTHQKNK